MKSTAGLTAPSAPGGVHTATVPQPASRAGTPSMSKVLNNAAEPPGTYSPTRGTGTAARQQRTPGWVSTTASCGRWAA